jgi:hypothetical protein
VEGKRTRCVREEELIGICFLIPYLHLHNSHSFVRLLLYTCRMYEGGLCVLDKFMATTNKKKLDQAEKSQLDMCHKLQPVSFLISF